MLPELLRDRLKASVKDFWRNLPVRTHFDFTEGLLFSDLFRYHTDEYKQNFVDTCDSLVNASGARREIPNQIQYKDRLVCVGKFVVGIDPHNRFNNIFEASRSATKALIDWTISRVCPTGHELNGVDAFPDDHPELQNKVVLIQIAVPCREDATEYKAPETEMCTFAVKINGKNTKSQWRMSEKEVSEKITDHTATLQGTPLLYMHRSVSFNELTALYLHELNLVAFEYVACQQDRHGVLVLSEFAGAASFMTNGSIPFHHGNKTGMSEALYSAFILDEPRAKYEHLRDFIKANTRFQTLLYGYRQPLTFAMLNGAKPSLKSFLLVANGQKTHVDLRLLLPRLFSGTRAQELRTCMRCHKKPIRRASLDLLGLEVM
ncbi:Alpha-alpha-trehalose-phosphate synthase subunit [Penicillium sp. DV-2018c]|nr:Alpha-alpha-trehalose-phosphate synthase subunit [Penicillium sp. DV-2018c]